jgi:poly(A) polymerase
MTDSLGHISAAWLQEAGFRQICRALAEAGFVVRAVGGAVRDSLRAEILGLDASAAQPPAADIDLATDATPDETIAAMTAQGLRTIPTGLAHGTITVLTDTGAHEVTTLRADVETDGRHASVAFTRDWQADATRRDFTINAIYCDPDGTVFDPVGGLDDLRAGHLRFIGDAEARIREDYLRILRLFRFFAQLPEVSVDEADLLACTRCRDGLRRLSRERIRTEFLKLIAAEAAPRAIDALIGRGLWAFVTPTVPSPTIFERMIKAETALRDKAAFDATAFERVSRLASLCVQTPEDAGQLKTALRLSNDEADALQDYGRLRQALGTFDWSTESAARLFYRFDKAAFMPLLTLAAALARTPQAAETKGRLMEWARNWVPPKFPLTGNDAIAAGIVPGPDIGRALSEIEAQWIADDFSVDGATLKQRLHMLAQRLKSEP